MGYACKGTEKREGNVKKKKEYKKNMSIPGARKKASLQNSPLGPAKGKRLPSLG